MSFSSNLATWLGSAPNALQAGRVDCYVGANNDKTGYSLTAGSYVLRATSNQRGSIQLSTASSNTATISSVTITRAMLVGDGQDSDVDSVTFLTRGTLTNGTTVTKNKSTAAAGVVNTPYQVEEQV